MATSRFLFLAFAMVALAAAPQAQVVFDDFNDGDVSDVFTFSQTEAGIGVGTTEGSDGTPDTGLSVGINPAETGAFAGIVISAGDGTDDVSATSYLTFWVRPSTVQASNLPLTLEINLHEDVNGDNMYDGATEDEYQAIYRLSTGSGYDFVQIPLASFGDDNAVFPGLDDGFDFSKLLEIVIAIGGPMGPEYAFAIDEVIFETDAQPLSGTVDSYDDFNDGDVSDVFTFSQTEAGIGVGLAEGSDGTPDAALSVGLNPAETGAFAGIVISAGDGTDDASGSDYLIFEFNPSTIGAGNLPLTLEINLHEDVNGDNMYDGATEDEYQAIYRVSTGSGYETVLIPLASFGDDNAVFPGLDDGFDFSKLLEIVIAIGGPMGPEYAFAIDEIGFTSGVPVANEGTLPESFAPSWAVYPNPSAGRTAVTFDLVQAGAVRVQLYDLLGRLVATPFDGVRPSGTSRLTLDASDLAAGTYVVRLTTPDGVSAQRITLSR